MSEPLLKSIRRILLALGEENDMSGAFEFTASLAQTLDAELHGLYLEDVDLLHLAGLPFARETGTTTAISRRLQHTDIERGWQRQAARLQKNLSEAAERRQLRWSFQVVRGRIAALAGEVMATDVVAVTAMSPVSTETLQAMACPVLILPPVAAPGTAMAVLVDETPESESALRFAAALQPAETGGPLQVIVVAAPDRREQLRHDAEHVLSGAGIRSRTLSLTTPEVTTLTRLLRNSGVRTLVLAAGTAAHLPWLQPVLERPPCAVWLTR